MLDRPPANNVACNGLLAAKPFSCIHELSGTNRNPGGSEISFVTPSLQATYLPVNDELIAVKSTSDELRKVRHKFEMV